MAPFLPLFASLLSFIASADALWPIPRQLSTGTSVLKLSKSFGIDVSGKGLQKNTPGDLKQAIARTQVYLKTDALQPLVIGRGSKSSQLLEALGNSAPTKTLKKLVLQLEDGATVKSISEESIKALEERIEGYTLNIPSDGGDALIKANSTLGLFRGLTTFTQLFYDVNGVTYTDKAPVAIVDAPYYPWRGLHLDTARNFYPVSDIKRMLDAMSWTKINMWHWHVVDSQSFPLNLPEFPKLSENGAYSLTKRYSPEDVKGLVAYANARGIDVMMEIDTPGHTDIVYHTYPDYIACHEREPWTTYAYQPPAGQLRLTERPVIDFTKALFKSAASLMTGKYFSSGGDEINKNCYIEDPVVNATLTSTGQTLEQALDVFTQETHGALIDAGKTPVVWQEMVLAHDVVLDNSTVVLVWISSADAKAVASEGFKLVHAPSDYFYLDCGGGGWVGNHPNGNSWCDPFKTWQKAYSFNPLANLTKEESKNVLGGQQLLWSEQSDPNNMDSIMWPRAAASAEVFWTGPIHPNGKPLNGTEALARLHDLRYRYVQRGVRAIALQPEWCAVRPNGCDLP